MIPIKIKAKLNAYTKVSPLDNQFVDAPVDDTLYGRKNGIWVQIDENSNQLFRSEIEGLLDKQILKPDSETIVTDKNNKLAAVALYDEQYNKLSADDVRAQVLDNPITATELRSVLADLLSRLTELKARVDEADTAHKDHEAIRNNFNEINKIIGRLTDLKLVIKQLDGKNILFNPASLVDAIKTLESVVYSNFDIINGNVGDINDLQQSLKSHNLTISNLSQAVKELSEVIYDNFNKINNAVAEVTAIKEEQKTFVKLTTDQSIAGVKTYTDGIAVNGVKNNITLKADIKPGSNLSIRQDYNGSAQGVLFDAQGKSLALYAREGNKETRLDVTADGVKINGTKLDINSGLHSIKVETFDGNTLGSYISTILSHINQETSGELISIGFKVALNSTISANGFKISNQTATTETTEENGIGVFKGGEYYYLYPTKIVDNDYYFDCSIGELNSKATVKLTNNNEAYISGQYFNIDSSIVSQVFFTNVNVTALPLERLTIVYHI